jgi:hypothetical protein
MTHVCKNNVESRYSRLVILYALKVGYMCSHYTNDIKT